ncbi:MAG: amylo-alpha-1,6-glucosidase [Bacteroidales bacterium]|nr:amylo-alpha-1,6-glucosidase [Bacteroidales bacterium]
MSYLKFDKNLLINLEQSLPLEMLRTNKSGAYHCTTLVGCNTRKYHGLLVMPIPTLDDDNHVMLSTLDETVTQRGAEFNLGLHKYGGDNFSPKGHKYVREFTCEDIPKTIYRVGGVILSKEKVFISHENRILIKYTLLEAHSPTTLKLRPFLAFRNVNDLTHENDVINKSYEVIEHGIRSCLYEGYPGLYMQISKNPEFVSIPDWYRGIEYQKEQERGYDYKEDLFVPGYFEVTIEKGEEIIFSAGESAISPKSLNALFKREVRSRTPRTDFYNSLKNSAEQFYNKKGKHLFLLAGYPWFHVRARDTFIALPGTTLVLGNEKEFEQIMESASSALKSFMDHGQINEVIKEIDAPDIMLWASWTIQQYCKYTSKEKCKEKYGPLLLKMLNFIISGKHPNLFLHNHGLLYTDGTEKSVSWMNAMENGKPVTPRTGYLVEFNALWYNALLFAAELYDDDEHKAKHNQFVKLSEMAATSFMTTFVNEYGYLYDYVTGHYSDLSVRPNMLLAISLDYSPLNKTQRKLVLDVITRELLTPKGLRTLSPKSGGYNPYYIGNQTQRNYAYHQGTVWPWLMGPYAEAYIKIFGMSGISFLERKMIGFEEEMSNHCIGTLSELYDGNPPFIGRGAISTAMNVGEILRVLNLLETYNPVK